MRTVRAWLERLAGLGKRDLAEQELAEELRAHLEMRIADNVSAGMSPEEARRAALMESGGLELAADACRERRALPWATDLLQDIRFALRTLSRSPGFTALAAATLALGIGASTAIFSVVNAAMLQRLPFLDPDRLVMVFEHSPNTPKPNVVNPLNFLDWRDRNRSFESIAAFVETGSSLTGDGEPEQIDRLIVSPAFFPLLGVKPILGRWFTPLEGQTGGEHMAILSAELWRRRYGGDPRILGRRIEVDHIPRTIVGVMPPGFRFPQTSAEIWTPLILERSDTGGRYLRTLARLRPGVSMSAAQADMDVLASQLQKERPDFDSKWGITVISLREQIVGDMRGPLAILLGAVGLLLLLACANVANLMLMRGAGRGREIAIRGALGAGAWRIASQLLVESSLVGALAGTLGLAIGFWTMRVLTAALPDTISYSTIRQIRVDPTVLLFAIGLSVATGIVFGLAPAIKAARSDLQPALLEGGRGFAGSRSRLRNALVVAEVALAMVLLAGAGLLIRSFANLVRVAPGFDADHVLSMQLSENGLFQSDMDMLNFNLQVLQRVRQAPGVEAAGTTHYLPLGHGGIPGTGFWRADRPRPNHGEEPMTEVLCILPGYFSAMGIPIERGRPFGERDRKGAPFTVVVNSALARQFFPGEDPLGKKLYIEWGHPDDAYEIVGVVGDVHQQSLNQMAGSAMYLSTLQEPTTPVYLVTRTLGDPRQLARAIESEIHSMNRAIPISDVRTMEEYVADSVSAPRFHAILLGSFSALAVLLAAVGIFGVISYGVAQRTREIGVRRALGADTAGVIRLVLTQALQLAAAGVAIGLAVTFAAARVLRTMLFGIAPNDPLTFASVAVGLLFVAVLAGYLPACRAARIDPLRALRFE